MIVVDNSLDSLSLGDASLKRKSANALSTPGSLEVASLTLATSGVTFPDNSVQSTAAVAYSLPVATGSVLGGVKAGSGVSIAGDGTLSATGSSSSDIYNNTSRYQMVSTTGITAHCVSSATVYGGLSWSRSNTTITVTKNAHGRSVGERVNLRNTNVDNQSVLITATTTNTFDVTVTNTGGASGSAGAYSLGFTFAHNAASGSISGGTLTAPANADVQLISLRLHLAANTRTGTTYALIVPASITNGAGGDTSNEDIYIPMQQVRQDGATLVSVGNTIATNISGSYATFQYGALPTSTVGVHILMGF